ncbi:HAD-like hydrolase family protein [Gracilaria domingensis]|nr:HAD-like hydrolase family protein [Gracilaria domingensis]
MACNYVLPHSCLNSDSIHFECYRDTLLELVPSFNNGQPITREYYDSDMSGRQNPELVAQILPQLSLEEQTHIWKTKESRYEDVISQGVSAITGLKQLLERCEKEGIITYVVTNAPKDTCVKTMESIEITKFFGTRVVVAEECERPKPHPAPYLRAMELASVSASEAIAFEDSPSGTTSATAAGLLTVGMRSTQTDEALRSFGAAFTVSDYNDPKLVSALSMWLK